MYTFVTTAKTYESARRTKGFLERNGIPAEMRRRQDGCFTLLTYPAFQSAVRGLRSKLSA